MHCSRRPQPVPCQLIQIIVLGKLSCEFLHDSAQEEK
jgi:hypothetical protein